MNNEKISLELNKLIKKYRWIKDTEGMSPAKVYKLVGESENLYLKMTDSRYKGTTYDVEREKDMMLWLKGKLPVPEVLHFEKYEGFNYLLMSEVDGVMCYEEYEIHKDPKKIVELYAECIKRFQSIDISDCPFNNNTDSRLTELDYMLNNNLADVDCENWEKDTPFKEPGELYEFLKNNKPREELVFSHGDLGDSNILVRNNKIRGFIDLGRSGKADKWYDIAFCIRSIREDIGEEKYVKLFFDLLGIEPDWEKIKYYILLDELF
ncbi:aminoglycoside 3'-phosphotransferase [Clostridium sp. MSJ-4]|uniref:Aminoglycoside 3'-phosphotransferase n=1 Tax=Clostridium simiarum TaxID=2841506 RepID=A0ABS6EZJ6_9CLOT|nr:APH(3') family aminoglycoside O-phosphotransferase [Clostridium simiarum]MBU5591672.1 aminoglycoside 3'-phosphotransferase [Clostridium simiarum]